jgi:hypothetical protein
MMLFEGKDFLFIVAQGTIFRKENIKENLLWESKREKNKLVNPFLENLSRATKNENCFA